MSWLSDRYNDGLFQFVEAEPIEVFFDEEGNSNVYLVQVQVPDLNPDFEKFVKQNSDA